MDTTWMLIEWYFLFFLFHLKAVDPKYFTSNWEYRQSYLGRHGEIVAIISNIA
jgi:hypothetical protein